jgi:hypothetical protein
LRGFSSSIGDMPRPQWLFRAARSREAEVRSRDRWRAGCKALICVRIRGRAGWIVISVNGTNCTHDPMVSLCYIARRHSYYFMRSEPLYRPQWPVGRKCIHRPNSKFGLGTTPFPSVQPHQSNNQTRVLPTTQQPMNRSCTNSLGSVARSCSRH